MRRQYERRLKELFLEWLRNERVEQRLSQKEMAKKLCMSERSF